MNVTELIERLRRLYREYRGGVADAAADGCDDAADALEAKERTIDELRNALACEMDDTRNACGALNAEIERIRAERDEAVALLRSAPIDPGYVAAEEWEIECAAFLAKLEAKP